MSFAIAFALAVAASLLVSEPAAAQPAPSVVYAKDGVRFEHPPGWKVTEDAVAQDETRLRSIDLEGPNEAVVTLMFSPFLRDQDIAQFAAATAGHRAEAAKAQRAKMGPVAATAITRNVAGQERPGVSQRFVVSMLGQRLPHEARFFKASLGETTVIAMTQVAEEYAKASEPGFAMVLSTLRYQAGQR